MVRVKRGTTVKAKHNKLKKYMKGMTRLRTHTIVKAKEALLHKDRDAYIGRKKRKRDIRSLWIVRINAAARQSGISYSQLMKNLKEKGVDLNRKVLSEIAYSEPKTFANLVASVKN